MSTLTVIECISWNKWMELDRYNFVAESYSHAKLSCYKMVKLIFKYNVGTQFTFSTVKKNMFMSFAKKYERKILIFLLVGLYF